MTNKGDNIEIYLYTKTVLEKTWAIENKVPYIPGSQEKKDNCFRAPFRLITEFPFLIQQNYLHQIIIYGLETSSLGFMFHLCI